MARAGAHTSGWTLSKTVIVACAAVLTSSVAAFAVEPTPAGLQVITPAIPLSNALIVDPNGSPVPLDKFKGKTVVLNIWATWCGPCVKELPSLDRLAAKLDANTSMVLAISQDKGGAVVARQFLDKVGVKNLSAYADPTGKFSRDLGIRGLPTTFIISPGGAIVGRVEGPLEWDTPKIVDFVNSRGS